MGTRVALFGGRADGATVTVQFLDDPIGVYRDRGGQLQARPAGADGVGGQFLGTYEFVGPRGPEQPVFVHRSDLRPSTRDRR